MLIKYENYESLITENVEDLAITALVKLAQKEDQEQKQLRISTRKDSPTQLNKFRTRPQGVVIQDSYNNFAIPIRPAPQIDTAKFDLLRVIKRYRQLYTDFTPMFLPWHFCVELVHDRYFVFNTRPLNLKYPLDTNHILNNVDKSNWDSNTKTFFDRKLFDINQAIHICIIGDSNLDVYPSKVYQLIGRTCFSPILQFKMMSGATNNIFPLNMGTKFKVDLINKYIRK